MIIVNSTVFPLAFETKGSSGVDLKSTKNYILMPSERTLIPTGVLVDIPNGFEAQVRSRSGLALKSGIAVVNSPGTIDADYDKEIGVILINHGNAPYNISEGDRIAQLVFCPIVDKQLINGVTIYNKVREDGFGHTGK